MARRPGDERGWFSTPAERVEAIRWAGRIGLAIVVAVAPASVAIAAVLKAVA